ncbi:MAG: hypothetical protein ACLFR5_02665 [Halobacteriales archaeon]
MYRHHRNIARVLSVFLLLIVLSSTAAGFDLPQPDHGIDDDFDKLWSAYDYDPPPENGSALEYLTRSSDYFYAEPPDEPARWNAGETESFDGGGGAASVHPSDANLTDGEEGLVYDAYVSVFAVSPSTIVHYSPDRETRYVGTSGDVHAFVDYRVEGADSHSADIEVVETGNETSGTGGVTVPYDGLGAETLTVRATVEATRTEEDGNVTNDTVTVEDEVGVQPYNVSSPSTVALRTSYPDGDTAAFVVRGTPWSSVKVSNSTVHSNWRFFSARDTDWDESLVVDRGSSTGEGETYHPLRVHAYPSDSGYYVDGDAEVRDTLGDSFDAPTLPDGVNVDVVDSEYETTRAADLRYNGSDGIEVTGILGDKASARTPPVNQEIEATNLTLSVVERNRNGVDVRVSLRDENGEPIDTEASGGEVRLEGRTNVTTELDGTATVNVTPRPSGAVFARYVPNDWHDTLDESRGDTPYEGDTDTLIVRSRFEVFEELGMLAQLGVFVLPFLVVTYMLDKAFGLGVWPPWRRL